jgi:hypothetical protein
MKMKKLLLSLGATLAVAPAGIGETLNSAQVTKVVNDVKLFHPSAAAQAARIGDTLNGKNSLQTGRRYRSELRFQDATITRVGANSIFSFDQGTRDLHLEQGTILLTVPKNAGGARIRTATVTAAVTGTTIMMEYFLKKWVKIIVLEGSLDAWVERQGVRSKKTIKAGEMLVLKAEDQRMPNPVDVDLQRLLQTSGLADRETFGPLPDDAENRIAAVVTHQTGLKGDGFLVPITSGRGEPGGGGPGDGGGAASRPAERATNTRELVNDSVEPPPPPREGDDPAG